MKQHLDVIVGESCALSLLVANMNDGSGSVENYLHMLLPTTDATTRKRILFLT